MPPARNGRVPAAGPRSSYTANRLQGSRSLELAPLHRISGMSFLTSPRAAVVAERAGLRDRQPRRRVGFSCAAAGTENQLWIECASGRQCEGPAGEPMELLEGLTDDQKAVLGGMAALFISGAIMSASYHLGRWTRAKQTRAHALGHNADASGTSEARTRAEVRKAA